MMLICAYIHSWMVRGCDDQLSVPSPNYFFVLVYSFLNKQLD